MAAPALVKSYNLINENSFTGRRLELQQNGQTILWVNQKTPFMQRPIINIQTQSEKGPIVAACRSMAMGSGLRVLFSGGEKDTVDPYKTPKESWYNVVSSAFSNRGYEFRLGGGRYVWRRTRNPALGASSWGGMDYKLLDISQGDNRSSQKVLAVYVKTSKLFNRHDVGRIDFMAELGLPLELMSLAAILGIQGTIQRGNSAGAGGGGGGGGGA